MNIDSPLAFTEEELLYLQNLLNHEREAWFNWYIEATESGLSGAEDAHDKYLIAKSLRNKFYHLGGRDTLAPSSPQYHEQRKDQGHDW